LVPRYETLGYFNFYPLPWNNGRFERARFVGRDGDLAILIDEDGEYVRFNVQSLKLRATALENSGFVPSATCAALRDLDHPARR
jgi:hypothetical protein